MLVYPGHKNRAVTLELANHGNNPILLYAEMKVARVALMELKIASSIEHDQIGKYRDQDDVGPPVFSNEFCHFTISNVSINILRSEHLSHHLSISKLSNSYK